MLYSIVSGALFATLSVNALVTASSCRNIPGDKDWPSSAAWQSLNSTVAGRLIQTTPIAQVCHGATYSQGECSTLADQWDEPGVMTPLPAEILHPWFQNQTCVPFTAQTTPCELGNYASYSINVSSVEDISAGLEFAQKHNIRLVIKNSGHDYYGKSTGKGALSLWTHNLVDQEVITSYNSSYYHGPALKAGAGVGGGDRAKFASEHGYRLVVGTCPDVGFVGGLTQGGGHSLLTGLYGLGADNFLEWEVITALGEHVIATPSQNSDLYQALSGGGGGTYGIVISMTVRLFEDGPISSATMSFDVSMVGGVDAFWEAVGVFTSELQDLVDGQGLVAAYQITNESLSVYTLIAPGHTADSLTSMLVPMQSSLKGTSSGLLSEQSLNVTIHEADGYVNLYSATLEPLIAAGTLSPVMGGRFVSRDNMATAASNITDSMRAVTEDGTFWLDITALSTNSSVRMADPIAANAVSPAFADAFLSIIVGAAWDWDRDWEDTTSLQSDLVNRIMPTLEAATPGAGAYLNEGNWQQDDWQQVFYGSNYERLRQIKNTYDPSDVFYGLTAVGSEAWTADADGRLCKTGM